MGFDRGIGPKIGWKQAILRRLPLIKQAEHLGQLPAAPHGRVNR